jgi:hypothetical protein
MTTRMVRGFLPITSRFAFPNAFPGVPVRRIGIPGVVSVPIGDAERPVRRDGLRGSGLLRGRAASACGHRTAERGALFDYLVDRLFDSFGLPLGPARYLELMSPCPPTTSRSGADRGSRRTVAPGG